MEMEFSSRFLLCLLLSWSFLICGTHQLQSSHTQVLLQLRKQLEYPNLLDSWVNTAVDFCSFSTPQVNITCENNVVTEIRVFGDKQQSRPNDYDFDGYPIPSQTLSQNFSMDSLITTLTRLNSLRVLSLVSLGMWGPVPDKIHRLQSLEYLDLSWNFLYGYVPQTMSRLAKLKVFKMDGNFLNGTLPDWFDSLSNLTSLSLSSNRFSGPLPSSIRKVTSLTDINLSKNGISGKVLDLSSLSRLQWVDFSNNKLDSELPNMPKQVTAVLLSNNSFTGKVPDQYGNLNQLRQLDLSSNALQGTISGRLFMLPSIVSLNLSSNMLMGSLPMRMTCSEKLELFDVSNNRWRGLVPSCLSTNAKNRSINLEGNCLSIDQEHQHPETYCMEEERVVSKKKSVLKNVVILIGVIGGIVVLLGLLSFGFLVLCRRYCPRGTSEQHLLHKSVQDNSVTGFTSGILTEMRIMSDAAKFISNVTPTHRQFSLDELKAATNNFEKASLIGEGSNGKLYKGRLENGDRVAIRCLSVSRKYTIRNLKLRLDLLAKLRHPHLVCLLGHCIENEEKYESGANTVYFIYEYVPNGTYQANLSDGNILGKVLKWSDRLAILIGVAKAVHFLHTGVIPGFFNNGLKASNILLTEHWMGKLSDYGLSVVAQETDKDKAEDGLKSWQTNNVDDIYCFGLILLESLVGPSVRARKESFLLNEMVSLTNTDGQKRVIDPLVLATSSQESLSIVVSLTINCISPESSASPSFEDILWNLQYAAQVQADSCGDHRTGKGILSP